MNRPPVYASRRKMVLYALLGPAIGVGISKLVYGELLPAWAAVLLYGLTVWFLLHSSKRAKPAKPPAPLK
ncbi:hypothetical protein [Massilia glaciei]|nr:hypothetical protein [Massilia glaciei]